MWWGWIEVMLARCSREGADDDFGGATEGDDTAVVFGGQIALSFVVGREDGGGV